MAEVAFHVDGLRALTAPAGRASACSSGAGPKMNKRRYGRRLRDARSERPRNWLVRPVSC